MENEVADPATECDGLDASAEQTRLRGNVRAEFYAGLCQEIERDAPVPEGKAAAATGIFSHLARAMHQRREARQY